MRLLVVALVLVACLAFACDLHAQCANGSCAAPGVTTTTPAAGHYERQTYRGPLGFTRTRLVFVADPPPALPMPVGPKKEMPTDVPPPKK